MTHEATPFSIAVTGHRDIRPQDVPALRQEVAKIFKLLRNRMSPRPLTLLSGLAEGADQLVAEVARENGLQLTAVIPMPLDVYREQLSPAAQQTLDDLYAVADARILLPLDDQTHEELSTSEEARAECYEALALYLVRNSQALIALWDGQPSDKAGGTCRVVNYARFGSDPSGAQHIESHCETVYHVTTPRLSNDSPAEDIHTTILECLPTLF